MLADVDEYVDGEEQQLCNVDNNDSVSFVSFQDSPVILPTQSADIASQRIEESVVPSIPPPSVPQSSSSGDRRLVLPASPLEFSSLEEVSYYEDVVVPKKKVCNLGGSQSRGASRSRGRMRTRGGAQQAVLGKNRRAVIKEWKNEDRRSNRSFQFTGKPGVKVISSAPASPISILKIFIGDSLIEGIVEYTSTYANILQNNPEIQEQIANKNRSIYKDWYDTNLMKYGYI